MCDSTEKMMINDYIANIELSSILNKYNCARTTFYRILRRNNISIKKSGTRAKSLNENLIIKKYLNGATIGDLGKEFQCDYGRISDLLVRNNITINSSIKYNVDLNFFKSIDSNDKAHILGLLYSDGTQDGRRFSFTSIDKECVEKVKEKLCFDGPITSRIPNHLGKKLQYTVTVSREEMCEDLSKLGCPPNKSKICKFPSDEILPAEFHSSFILGVLEGDGSIGKNSVSFCGTENMMLGIKLVIENNLNPIHLVLYPQKGVYSLYSNRRDGNQRLLDWLYSNDYYMNRKYERYKLFYKGV